MRRRMPAGGALALAACTGSSPTLPTPVAPDAPNVLLVSLDTLRSDRLSLYGHDRPTAPGLSAIAAQGAWFPHSWSAAPETDGSHGSLFTGRAVSSHGKYGYGDVLPDREVTLAEVFASAGYDTWAATSSDKFVCAAGFDQGFADYDLYVDGGKMVWSAQAHQRALEQMSAPRDRPWFGFVHLFDPHAPYTSPEPYESMFLRGALDVEPPKTVHFIREHRRDKGLSDDILYDLVDLYDGAVANADERTRSLWHAAQLSRRDTVVIVTSDHGEAFHEHRYLGHDRELWEELVRVPLVVWAPGRVAPGTVIDAPVHSFDVLPTVLELAGLQPPAGVEGQSVAPALTGAGPAPTGRMLPLQDQNRWGVVADRPDGRFKLIAWLKSADVKLFDLTSDPGETTNLASQRPDVVEALQAELVRLGVRRPRRFSVEREKISEAELEALKEIGYVE